MATVVTGVSTNERSKPKMLIFQGAGFLGHHLVHLLLSQGRDVVVMDSMWTGSINNIHSFEQHGRFRYVQYVRVPRITISSSDSATDAT